MFPSQFPHHNWPVGQNPSSEAQQAMPWYGPSEPSTSHPASSSPPYLPSAPPASLALPPRLPRKTTVIVDGSNVAMSHGQHKVYSWKGIDTCVKFFQQKGNPVYVVTPQWRKGCHAPAAKEENLRIIASLEEQGVMAWTPSRPIGSRMTSSYDDPFILTYAQKTNGVVVSNDYFRDVLQHCPQFREIIEERTLMFTFFEDAFFLPADQQGKYSKISTEGLLSGTSDGWTGGMVPQSPMDSNASTSMQSSQAVLDPGGLLASSSSTAPESAKASMSSLRLKKRKLRRKQKKKADGILKKKTSKRPEVKLSVVKDYGSSADGWNSPFSILPMSDVARRFLLTTKPEITTAVYRHDGSIDWVCVLCMKKFREERFLLAHLDSPLHRQRLNETVRVTEDFCRDVVFKVSAAGIGLFLEPVNDCGALDSPEELEKPDETAVL